nr:CPBP family intramembrane glutamic endopeptidase [Patulibacter sp. SYSU D01012]
MAGGDAPTWGALGRFSGTAPGVGWVVLAVLLNGVGEETGWRGWLLPRLRRRHGAVPATLLLTVAWAAWHAPFFALLTSYGDFGVVQLPGFVLGLAAGALVLTWLWERTGGSLLAVALWHAAYNLTVATDAGAGVVAAAVTTVVMVGALAVLPALRRRGPTAAQPPAGPVSIG